MKPLLRILALVMIFSAVYVSREAAAIPVCRGTCTVHCTSGATYYYFVPEYQCCAKSSVCPNAEGWAEWQPSNYPECWGSFGSICP